MFEESKDKLLKPTITDTIVSTACTRSATFALLLTMVLFSLVPYWLQENTESFVGRYLSLRLNLYTAIDQLDDDSYWLTYKASHDNVESMSMEQLLGAKVEIPAMPTQGQSKSTSPPKTKISFPGRPTLSPPTMISISISIDGIDRIAGLLIGLNDSDLLTTSRKASGLFDYSIYRWLVKRNSFIKRNMLLSRPSTIISETTEKNQQDRYDPALPKSDVLRHLTLRDVRELARYELPKIDGTVKLRGSGGKEIELAPGSLPRNLYMASVFAEVLILFVVMYFKAFTGEATLSAAFPATGTLFGAFSRSSLSVVVFFLGLWSPFAVSLAVAWSSRKLPLLVLGAMVGLAVLSVHRVLQSNSFFAPLTSAWKALRTNGRSFD